MGFSKGFMKLLGIKPEAEMPEEPVSRWEKAVTAVNGLAREVAKMDPDGIDVYCFNGEGVKRYRNIKDTDALAQMVDQLKPKGHCTMNQAVDVALKDCKAKVDGGSTKPCSMLVLTAGLPDDEAAVTSSLTWAVQELSSNLTITFVHVGDDPKAEVFLKHIDDNLTLTEGGKTVDIIDTVKDEDIQKAMDEMNDPGFKTGMVLGGLMGAFAGVALGAGGAHLMDRHFAKKRTAGWNGEWEVFMQPDDVSSGVKLTVMDFMDGTFTIEGYPEDGSCGVPSEGGTYEDIPENENEPAGYTIQRAVTGDSGIMITGNVVDEHVIEWSDKSIWREVPPPGANWVAIGGGAAAGGVAGALAGGALGALCQKKFFKGTASKTEADYVILIDCSESMNELDTGKGFKAKAKGYEGSDAPLAPSA